VIEDVPTIPGVHEHVAVHGDAVIETDEQIAVEPSLKVTVPACAAVAVSVTAVPNVAVVALPSSATEIDVDPNAVPSMELKRLV
jgi:hypothetical protein